MLEILYGRDFSIEEMSSQPVKAILFQSLLYDDELEKEYIENIKGGDKKGLIVVGKSIKQIKEEAFNRKHPWYKDCIVTLLTSEEYTKIASASKHYD